MQFISTRRALLYTPPVVSGAWTPASLGSALIGWWKADAGVTPGTNGSATTQWDDQSGVGNHLTPSVTGPTYTTNVLNSLPGMVFSTTETLRKTSFAIGGTTASVFMVGKITSVSSNPRGASYESPAGSGNESVTTSGAIFFFHTSTTSSAAFRNGGFRSQGTIAANTFLQMGNIYDGTNNTMYLAGTGQTPVADTNTFGATGTFGINTQGLTYGATVCEMFITNSAMSGTDRTNTASYFLTKWGV